MNPESIVKSFIEDYFRWNEESFARMEQLRTIHDAALISLGIYGPLTDVKQIPDLSRFLQIQQQDAHQNAKVLSKITEEYTKIVKKYCRPDYQHQNVSYGGDSSHHPDNEKIISVEETDDCAVVKTKLSVNGKYLRLTRNYEYCLINEEGKWFLEHIYYIYRKKRYESL